MKQSKARISQAAKADEDLALFETVFSEHWPRICSLLCRLVGDPSEAEDLALEAFFRLYQRHQAAEPGFNTGGWLYRVATNLGLHSLRSLKRRQAYELKAGRLEIEALPQDRPAEILDEQEEQRLARLALSQMKEKQARLLILRYSGLSYREIAAAMELSTTSIGPLLVRAEREFEKRYRALAKEET